MERRSSSSLTDINDGVSLKGLQTRSTTKKRDLLISGSVSLLLLLLELAKEGPQNAFGGDDFFHVMWGNRVEPYHMATSGKAN